jgi:tetratricopeptide (TPR) repeat protein
MTREEEVIATGRAAVEKMLHDLGPDDPRTLDARCALGRVLYLNREFTEAGRTLEDVLSRQVGVLSHDDERVLKTELFLAAVHFQEGEYEEALRKLLHIVKVSSPKSDDDTWPLNPALSDLARVLSASGKFAEEVPIRQRVLASFTRMLSGDDQRIFEAKFSLATALRSAGEFEEALELDRLILLEQEFVPENRSAFLATRFNLAVDLLSLGQTDEGEKLGYEAYQAIMAELPPGDPVRRTVEPFRKEFERYRKTIERESSRRRP